MAPGGRSLEAIGVSAVQIGGADCAQSSCAKSPENPIKTTGHDGHEHPKQMKPQMLVNESMRLKIAETAGYKMIQVQIIRSSRVPVSFCRVFTP